MTSSLHLVPYTEEYLGLSWNWLNEPEVKKLTMTPDFSRSDQQRFFDGLPVRADYQIWGVALANGRPIGAAGLKNIDGRIAEYWGYIGEKDCWGQGLGGQMLGLVEKQARQKGLESLYLTVAQINPRAVSLYRRCGYALADNSADPLIMRKDLER